MQPVGRERAALVWALIGPRIGPFAQGRLDEAFSFAIGPWGVWPGSDMAQSELFTGPAEREGFVARTVVAHHALDLDAEICIVGYRSPQESGSASFLLIWHHLGEGDAGVVVNSDVYELPTGTPGFALSDPSS